MCVYVLCMYVCIYINMYIYIYIYICWCMCVHVYVYVYVGVCSIICLFIHYLHTIPFVSYYIVFLAVFNLVLASSGLTQ